MNTNKPSRLVRRIRQLAQETAALPDAQLLECFLHGDDVAFEALLRRHGPMVLAVCRRVLGDAHDAEDAFQACFLVLVRKAASIGKRELLANWLYGVAYRTAVKARRASLTRKSKEKQVNPRAVVPSNESMRDWISLLDQELSGLPRKYQSAIVLCDLEGHARRDAARLLDLPERTLSTRLARGRAMLAKRLARHGFTLSGGFLAGAVAQHTASAAVPRALLASTIHAASFSTLGNALAAGAVSTTTAVLAEGALRSMMMAKLKIMAIVLVCLGIAGGSARLCGLGADEKGAVVRVPSQREGILQFIVGAEITADEAVPNDAITVQGKKYRPLKKGDPVKTGQLLGQIDDRLARDELAIKKAKIVAAEADWEASDKAREEGRSRYETGLKLKSCMGREDLRERKLVWEKYVYEAKAKKEAIETAKLEGKQAETVVSMHEIRSPVDGVIKSIRKKPGEAVRALETVLEIQTPDKDD
jgi:RNA polymerase sigma factor (sigma-70 family)